MDGSSSYNWQIKATGVRCFIDLQLLTGVDPYFTPAGGRPGVRAGRLFVEPTANGGSPVAAGDHIVITRGPKGTFKIEQIIDEVWTPEALHHFEYGVTEVAPQIARKEVSQP